MIMKRDLEPTDAEIEAIVAEAIAAEATLAKSEAQPPSSAIVWWRAQMRARQEAAQMVERPLTIVHALAISCGIGVLAALVGTMVAGVKGSLAWVTGIYQSAAASAPAAIASIDLTSRWITVPMTAMLISALVASIAAYFIYADE